MCVLVYMANKQSLRMKFVIREKEKYVEKIHNRGNYDMFRLFLKKYKYLCAR